MIALALELSSRYGSAALLSGFEVLAEEIWDEKNFRGQHVFRVLPGMLRNASVTLEAVELFAVGRGPGSYSGLRVAITAAQSFALPGRKTVYALSSGEALAREIADRENISPIAIVGDARRGTVWFGLFEVRDQALVQVKSWTVLPPDKLSAELPRDTLVVSSDMQKLSPFLKGLNLKRFEQDCFPKAKCVGQLALRKLELGQPSEPFTPIYTQPAVAKPG
jgi:N6-L-threonylcarbamoyladenine synthase/tRNA threonylcarbamoyladenosine biosynthesis protein TsaB